MISVVIPTFRRQNRLRELLGSLERQVTDVPFEVIVVANLPEPGLKKVVESYGPQFRFHETGRIGVNLARNKGLERARGTVVVCLDDDTYVTDRMFLQKHFVMHERHPEAIAIGGTFTPKSDLSPIETAYHWILHHQMMTVVLERNEAVTLSAGNVSFKSALLDRRFDDRILYGSSELSLFQKLRADQNLFLLSDTLSVEHRLRLNMFDIARRAFYRGYGRGLTQESAAPLRPHWNSIVPLNETFRRAHVAPTPTFRLAVRVYGLFEAYGLKLGLKDAAPYVASLSSKKITYRRPDFTPLKMLSAFFSGRYRAKIRASLSRQVNAFRASLLLR